MLLIRSFLPSPDQELQGKISHVVSDTTATAIKIKAPAPTAAPMMIEVEGEDVPECCIFCTLLPSVVNQF